MYILLLTFSRLLAELSALYFPPPPPFFFPPQGPPLFFLLFWGGGAVADPETDSPPRQMPPKTDAKNVMALGADDKGGGGGGMCRLVTVVHDCTEPEAQLRSSIVQDTLRQELGKEANQKHKAIKKLLSLHPRTSR